MTDILLRKATLEDEEGILQITREENLWDGMDYLPFALNKWLREAEEAASNRENYVLVLADKIVGFRSVHFMRARTSCAMFAMRVSREIRGKGYGKAIQSMMTENILKGNPNLKTALSAKPDRDMTDKELVNPKHGTLLTVKVDHTFKMKWSDLPIVTEKHSLQKLSKEKFSKLLLTTSLDHLFEGGVVHMNWVPVKLASRDRDDIEFVTRKKQIVLMDDNKKSLSILTLPYPSSGGTRMSIDFFGDDKSLLKQHIKEQLRQLRDPETMTIIKERHQGEDIGVLFLSVFLNDEMTNAFMNFSEELEIRQFYQLHGSVQRDHYKMYIYEKSLQNKGSLLH